MIHCESKRFEALTSCSLPLTLSGTICDESEGSMAVMADEALQPERVLCV
jgi:hypothetical protein